MRRFSGSQLPPSAVSASSPAFSPIVPPLRFRDVSRPPAADRDTVFRSARTLGDEETEGTPFLPELPHWSVLGPARCCACHLAIRHWRDAASGAHPVGRRG